MKFTSPKGETRISLLSDHPLWTTLIPCNRQKTYLQVPHWYLGPVYKERGLLKLALVYKQISRVGLPYPPRSTSPALLTCFTQIFGLTVFKLSRLLVMHDRGKLFRVGKLSLAEHLKGR